jgi:hypothetical protein
MPSPIRAFNTGLSYLYKVHDKINELSGSKARIAKKIEAREDKLFIDANMF